MMLSGVLTTALALAGAFFFPHQWESFCIPFICWLMVAGWVLIAKGRHVTE